MVTFTTPRSYVTYQGQDIPISICDVHLSGDVMMARVCAAEGRPFEDKAYADFELSLVKVRMEKVFPPVNETNQSEVSHAY